MLLKIAFAIGMGFMLSMPAIAGTIAISVPLSGDYEIIGQEFREGAEQAINAKLPRHNILIVDDGCDPNTSERSAEILAKDKPDIAIGFLCNDTAIIAANRLRESKIPMIIAGAQSVRLIKDRDREAWHTWRLSPGDDYQIIAAAKTITNSWQKLPFAIVDDGTIFGRRFSETLQFLLNESGIKPLVIDTFRTSQSTQAGLIRRLQRSGVQAAFFAASNADDLLTVQKDSMRLGLSIDIITTNALRGLELYDEKPQTLNGFGMIDWLDQQPIGLKPTKENQSLSRSFLSGYAAGQIAAHTLQHGSTTIEAFIQSTDFQTVLGAVRFNLDGSSTFNPFVLKRWNGQQFRAVDLDNL